MKKELIEKKCIWCLKTEPEVTFIKRAHTIPKSLGGKILIKMYVMIAITILGIEIVIMVNILLKLL
jgi:hypothetical protein